jgi:Flp pilus assembly protein TadG
MQAFETFRRNSRAVAALEFGLALPFLILVFAAVIDFGFAQWNRSAMSNAVADGAYYAFLTGPSVTAANVKSMVQNASSIASVTVPTINAPACYCISGAAAPATMTAATCGNTCADGTTAGKYIIITADYTLTSFFPSSSWLNFLHGGAIQDSATVRLQ